MITAIIFFVHFLFTLIIFTKKWQEENLSDAFINIGLIGLLFTIGWSISGIIAKLLMSQKGLGIMFDRDTFSLTILSVIEFFFYRMYYKDIFSEAGTEKQ
ncbi:MAG TPA: hypothetical protein VMV36_03740 [Ignavibacteriaceae bacterium]|nr:hypothetical protein [Ignavibacteriaceae bacterium]